MNNSVICFALEELDKYLEKLGVTAEIKLGLFKDFGIETKVKDPFLDDAIAISVKNRKGYIAGSNERSVLIGVYRLLEEWGITWVRPGPNGTAYPKKCEATDIEICEAADTRHRVMCIEGAVSIENELDMIEWLPKVGFNGYYIQFSTAYNFFDRWYSHTRSTVKQPEPFTQEQAAEYVDLMTKEIKKRGLLLQRMGHGWTCLPFGLSDKGWYQYTYDEIPKAFHDICALVDGERKCLDNRPLRTQLCYSNATVRKKITDCVINYAKDNPETDYIHFWLGDSFNKTCECDECRKGHLADHYIRIVNDITDELVKRNLKAKIVFLVFCDTSFPPKVERIKHPENTVLMFAPITRTFADAFPDTFKIREVPEYKTNKFSMPADVDSNLSYLYAWEQTYDGDVVDFDYHLMWDHILDAGGEGIAKILHQDIRSFESLGINGFISCQLQRNAFPSSIAMTVMAKTLWNTSTDFDTVRKKLYAASFGEDTVDELCNYFALLSEKFDIGVIRNQKPVDADEFKQGMVDAIKAMDAFKEVIKAHLSAEDPCRKDSWEYLELHRQIYSGLAEAIIAKLDGDFEKSKVLRDGSIHFAFLNEDKLQPVLDCMFYCRMTNERLNLYDPNKELPPLF